MKPRIYLVYGWWGAITSGGFHLFGERLRDKLGYEVVFCNPDPNAIARHVLQSRPQPLCFVGYSQGASFLALVAELLAPKRGQATPIDLVVGYDPTVNGPQMADHPFGRHVKRVLCYRNNNRSWLSTSLLFGRAIYERTSDGPRIEVTNICQDHLFVQNNEALHLKTIDAIKRVGK